MRAPLAFGSLRLVPISLVWFFCLGGFGLFFPYFTLYLRENAGLSGTQVGMVQAMLPALGMVAQPFWGHVADRTGSRTRVLVGLALGAAVGYSALALGEGFASFLALTALLACFSTPLVPTAFAVTLAATRDASRHAFGLVRVWGTVGFLLFTTSFPHVLDAIERARGLAPRPGGPSEPALAAMFPLTGALVAVGGLLALAIRARGALTLRAEPGDLRVLLSHPPYLRALVFTLLAYGLLQGPMAFFPIYVRAHGGTVDTVSHLWVAMLSLEIPLVALSGASLERLGARGLLAMGLGAGGVRWTVCGLAPESAWVAPVQVLHGVVVAGLVIGAPLYVEACVPERLRSSGQGVLAMMGVSLGGILSAVASGRLLDRFGPDAPYAAGGLGALALCIALPLLLPPPRRPSEPREP